MSLISGRTVSETLLDPGLFLVSRNKLCERYLLVHWGFRNTYDIIFLNCKNFTYVGPKLEIARAFFEIRPLFLELYPILDKLLSLDFFFYLCDNAPSTSKLIPFCDRHNTVYIAIKIRIVFLLEKMLCYQTINT